MPRKPIEPRERISVIAILWLDAVGSKEKVPLAVPTLDFGVVVQETDEELTLAHEIFADGEIRDRTTISKAMLIRRYPLKLLPAPKEFARYELKKLIAGDIPLNWRKGKRR